MTTSFYLFIFEGVGGGWEGNRLLNGELNLKNDFIHQKL